MEVVALLFYLPGSLANAQHGVHDAVELALVLGLGRLQHQRVRYWPRHGRYRGARDSAGARQCPLQLLRDRQRGEVVFVRLAESAELVQRHTPGIVDPVDLHAAHQCAGACVC